MTFTKSGGSDDYKFEYALKKMALNCKVTARSYLGFKKIYMQAKTNSSFSFKAVRKFKYYVYITDPQSPFIAVEAETGNPSEFTLIFVGMMPADIATLSKAIDSFKESNPNLDNVFEHFRAAFPDTSETSASVNKHG